MFTAARSFLERQSTVLLIVVAITSLATSFFVSGIVRAFLGIICMVCSLVCLLRAINNSTDN